MRRVDDLVNRVNRNFRKYVIVQCLWIVLFPYFLLAHLLIPDSDISNLVFWTWGCTTMFLMVFPVIKSASTMKRRHIVRGSGWWDDGKESDFNLWYWRMLLTSFILLMIMVHAIILILGSYDLELIVMSLIVLAPFLFLYRIANKSAAVRSLRTRPRIPWTSVLEAVMIGTKNANMEILQRTRQRFRSKHCVTFTLQNGLKVNLTEMEVYIDPFTEDNEQMVLELADSIDSELVKARNEHLLRRRARVRRS